MLLVSVKIHISELVNSDRNTGDFGRFSFFDVGPITTGKIKQWECKALKPLFIGGIRQSVFPIKKSLQVKPVDRQTL